MPLTRALSRSVAICAALLVPMTVADAGAQPRVVQPGAPGEPSRTISADEATSLAGIAYVDADVHFLQGMIPHHAQALEMTALVNERTSREAMRLLAERIELSQEDEIEMMQGWLRDRELEVPDAMAHHMDGFHLMPGMLTPEEMASLRAAEGAAFDTRFLELMIKHHQGALTMVSDLLGQQGSAQDSVLFAFASDVRSDQTSEIERMEAMLAGFSPDPRVNLAAGYSEAGVASANLELIAALPKPPGFFDPRNPTGLPSPREDVAEGESEDGGERREARPSLMNFSNTDMAFAGNVLIAGNYHGFNAYDIASAGPELLGSVVCPGGQGDVSIVGHLLLYSVEQTRARVDCGLQGVAEPTSDARFRGLRIFDISDLGAPRQVGAVQTCRGSHTHTVVTEPDAEGVFYVYVSGTAPVRSSEELEGCSAANPFEDPETALFSIDVVRIPMNRPGEARIVNRPRIFADPESGVIAGLWEGGDHGEGTQSTSVTNQCHDITSFPAIGLAAGACSGNGILLDISDPMNPVRIDQVVDPGFAYWHSATFNHDGTKVIFTDEWGGGARPRCRAFDPNDWGADAIYDIVDGKLEFRSHYKMPAPQTERENCVAHNGSLIPVPGRDIFVQAWYQGGISVIDFTDSSNPVEIAFFDRGPLHDEELVLGGYWSAYWYGGLIYGTEIARGLDVLRLVPSDHITANEIAAASFRDPDAVVNTQTQQPVTWPAEPVVARAYVDQLVRDDAIEAEGAAALRTLLDRADALLSADNGDAETAARLEALAASFGQAVVNRNAITSDRYSGLADTLAGIAARLR